ncbi:MerR family transcriptional regulator [Nonomuraea endophytica]|uniref:DNA-binding transcriptional MerR regulator n=1 Tax=Nonomuraea endophytica TaxID=714136 RepID=A0A7W8AHA2_9ACTN|nr:MerR family transcriptional regulator [Nonomuraea endophytica]MBB5085130.1 DNA-binding transcriptional MerR regulator [Nonomuraea endophytica]
MTQHVHPAGPALDPPTFAAGAVARRLGLPLSTLRSWNNRYGIGPSDHQPGRHRRYTETDIAALIVMQRLIAQGSPPAAAARAAQDRGPGNVPMDRDLIARLVDAAHRLDSHTTITTICQALHTHGVVDTWQHLCMPALNRVQKRVSGHGDCVDVEHLLSWSITTSLHQAVTAAAGAPVAMLACTAREHHSLPLEALNAALAERGVPALTLGTDVPDQALADAVGRARPKVVVLWSHTPATASLNALQITNGASIMVLAAGPGWAETPLPGRVIAVNDLPQAIGLITEGAQNR